MLFIKGCLRGVAFWLLLVARLGSCTGLAVVLLGSQWWDGWAGLLHQRAGCHVALALFIKGCYAAAA